MRFERIPWRNDIYQIMAASLQGDGDILKEQVQKGIAVLWQVNSGESHMITRGEIGKSQKTIVVCCYEGKELAAAAKAIIEIAKRGNYDAIRYHTKRKGMRRMIANKFGFVCVKEQQNESIYIKELRCCNGQSFK